MGIRFCGGSIRLLANSPCASTDEEVDLQGEIEVADEVILEGHRFRAEASQGTPPAPGDAPVEGPARRLRAKGDVWRRAMQSMGLVCTMTLSIINSGYRLEWNDKGPAPPVSHANHPSAFEDTEFIDESLAAGLAQGTMLEVTKGFLKCIHPLGKAIHARTQKKRLIYDARHVNEHLVKTKFKMESLHKEGRTLFRECDFGGTCDISQAYYHVDMHESAWPYLGFEWAGRFFCYKVLPFGLSTAPRIFTMVMKTPLALLRSQGCNVIAYLDDLPFGDKSAEGSMRQGSLIVSTLRDFGWIIQTAKCVGIDRPLRRFEVLGSLIDLVRKEFRVPDSKVSHIKVAVSNLLKEERTGAKTVARVKGLLSSTWLSTGEHARIRTRALDQVIQSRLREADDPQDKGPWRRKVALTPQARAELQWWLDRVEEVNGRPIIEDVLAGVFDGTIATDASTDGFGGWVACEKTAAALSVIAENARRVSSAKLTVKEAQRAAVAGVEVSGELPEEWQEGRASSTLREIFAAFTILSVLAPLVADGRFRLHLDNSASVMALGGRVPHSATGGQAPKSVLGGSRVPEIQDFVIRILDLAYVHKIRLVAVWIPRAENERADLLSRTTHLAQFEYNLKRLFFRQLDEDPRWGRHSTDMFSADHNVSVRSGRFCSRFYHPQAVWADALSFRWTAALGDMLWVHPPPRTIGAALTHMVFCGCRGTLITPRWQGAPWWPLLFPGGTDAPPAPFVREVIELGTVQEVMEGPGTCDGPSSHFSRSRVMAFRIVPPRAGGA